MNGEQDANGPHFRHWKEGHTLCMAICYSAYRRRFDLCRTLRMYLLFRITVITTLAGEINIVVPSSLANQLFERSFGGMSRLPRMQNVMPVSLNRRP